MSIKANVKCRHITSTLRLGWRFCGWLRALVSCGLREKVFTWVWWRCYNEEIFLYFGCISFLFISCLRLPWWIILSRDLFISRERVCQNKIDILKRDKLIKQRNKKRSIQKKEKKTDDRYEILFLNFRSEHLFRVQWVFFCYLIFLILVFPGDTTLWVLWHVFATNHSAVGQD